MMPIYGGFQPGSLGEGLHSHRDLQMICKVLGEYVYMCIAGEKAHPPNYYGSSWLFSFSDFPLFPFTYFPFRFFFLDYALVLTGHGKNLLIPLSSPVHPTYG